MLTSQMGDATDIGSANCDIVEGVLRLDGGGGGRVYAPNALPGVTIYQPALGYRVMSDQCRPPTSS